MRQELSPAERAVLELAAKGLTKQEIAEARGVSYRTIRRQVEMARWKLGAHNTTHAVALMLRDQVAV